MPKQAMLMWIPEGLRPEPGAFDLAQAKRLNVTARTFSKLKDAVDDAIQNASAQKTQGLVPWITIGTGQGTAIFNFQAILAMNQAPLK